MAQANAVFPKDPNGNQMTNANSATLIWCYILGALQQLVGLGSGGGTQNIVIGGPLGARAQAAALATTPAIVAPASEDVSIPSTEGGTQISPANANGRTLSIVNNGAFPLWIDYGGTAPIAETTPGDGTGRGIYIAPYGYWESPSTITTAVKGITTSGNTVSVRKTE
jgi:hypothetical protein